MLKKAIAFIAVAIAVLALFPAVSQASGGSNIEMSVTVGYGGKFVLGKTTPVVVTVKNSGAELSGALEITTGQGFSLLVRREVVLPQGSEKKFVLYVRPYSLMKAADFEVRLMRNGAVVMRAAPGAVSGIDPEKSLCGILSDDPAAVGYMKKILFDQATLKDWVDLSADCIYDQPGTLDSFSLIAVNGNDAGKLSERQFAAIRQWVYGGGTLILGTGPGRAPAAQWQEFTTGLSFSGGAAAADLSKLSSLALGKELEGPLPILAAGADGWTVNAEAEQGKPLVLSRAMGIGMVFVTAFDLGEARIGSWAGASLLWQTLLAGSQPTGNPFGNMYYGGMYGSGNSEGMRLALRQGLAGGGVTFLIFLVILVVFVALAGFAGFAILKALGRQKVMWVAVPVLSVVFSGLLLLFGANSFGRKPDIFAFTATDIAGEVSRSEQTIGFIAPAMGEYRLTVDGAGLLSPDSSNGIDPYMLQELNVRQPVTAIANAENGSLTFINVNLNGSRIAGFDSCGDSAALEYSFFYDGKSVVCRLKNMCEWPVEDVTVVIGGSYKTVGDLQPGDEEEVSLPLDQRSLDESLWETIERLYPSGYGYAGGFGLAVNQPRDDENSLRGAFLRQQMDGFLNKASRVRSDIGQALCFGWIQKPFGHAVSVNGGTVSPRSLELISVVEPVRQPGGGMQIRKIYGTLNASLSKSNVASAKGDYMFLDPGGTAVLDFSLAELVGLSVDDMVFEAGTRNQGPAGTWSIYNWVTNAWDAAIPKQHFNPEDTAKYTSPEGFIRMSIAVGPNDYFEGAPYIWAQGVAK